MIDTPETWSTDDIRVGDLIEDIVGPAFDFGLILSVHILKRRFPNQGVFEEPAVRVLWLNQDGITEHYRKNLFVDGKYYRIISRVE